MILSQRSLLSENQAVTATAVSTDILDLGLTGTPPLNTLAITRDLGPGEAIPILTQVTADFATLTSLTVTLETSANDDLSTPTVLISSGAIPVADLVAGAHLLPVRVFPDGALLRYIGFRYTVTGSNATAGTVTAAIGTMSQTA